jgi:hypothetical protein
VTALHQHVCGDGQLLALSKSQQRAVIAHAQRSVPCWPLEKSLNQIKLTHKRKHNRKLQNATIQA